jgi:hypothetical protein
MLAAPRPEPAAEAQELRLVDRREVDDHRCLDDLVLDRSDAERPPPDIRLRYVRPAGRERSIRLCVDTDVQVAKILFSPLFVHVPCHRVDVRGAPPLQREEGGA